MDEPWPDEALPWRAMSASRTGSDVIRSAAARAPDDDAAPVVDRGAPDAALVAAAASGNRDAFDVLVERHQRRVYQVCYRFAGNHADAADLTQDVFVRAYRAIGRFRGDAAFSTWLYRIAVNTALARASNRRAATGPLDEARNVPAREEPPDAAVLRSERDARVREAVASLPPKQRATVVLRVYQDLTLEEIARTLDRSVGTVKANLFFALRNLRTRLEGGDR